MGWLIASPEFVDDFYEYSSTSYGGPASLFYTMVELTARMERWQMEGLSHVGPAQLAEPESSYGLDLARLQRAYRRYAAQREQRAGDLGVLRDASCQLLYANGAQLLDPTYSINTSVAIGHDRDGYVFFRDLLATEGVSVFPGILTFVLSQDLVHFTSARSWSTSRAACRRSHDWPADRSTRHSPNLTTTTKFVTVSSRPQGVRVPCLR